MKTLLIMLTALLLSGAAQANPVQPADLYQEPHRPQFHFTPEQKWMNDPNGMFYYQGEYHLFYQYHPYSNVWGPMHWGHAVSTDMVHWEHLPVAIYPDWHGAIFSGSAVVDWNNSSGFGTEDNPPLVAIYTYHNHLIQDFGGSDYQSQGVAYSLDRGRTWTKYEDNPVLKNQGDRDFRDPKVFWYAQEQKWIMSLAVKNRISFYSSKNLKSWTFESDFGLDWGVHEGVWECPDLIEIPIAGSDKSKYLLLVSIVAGGPNGGTATQYFVGDFDGREFTVDPSLQNLKVVPATFPKGKTFEDFEKSLSRWTATGDTTELKMIETTIMDSAIHGKSFLSTEARGSAGTGSLRSTTFTIKQPFINFYVGGGADESQQGMRLLVDGKVVRRAAGNNSQSMRVASWDVSEFKGQQAQLEIIDQADGRWGHTHIDNIVFAKQAAMPRQESALWLDYGTDNYAGVTWSDIPAEDGRRLFIGWMSNWDYGGATPTERWRSAMTIPRKLTLHQSDQSFRVHSQPVRELEKLRAGKTSLENLSFDGVLDLGKKLRRLNGTMEILLSLDTLQSPAVTLTLANEAGDQTLFTIDRQQGVYKLDRTRSGKVDFDESFASVQTAPIVGDASAVSLQVFVDHSSVEIFINAGETVMTAQVFPTQPYSSVQLSSDGQVEVESADLYTLKSIWGKK
ncbi:glycoside hydrolase family 32 protein [Pseudomaricurvus alcaniphilus]|uniref:glycoside hydrolase family 32 protein n=1 Tax=Pseudomaricurvus alcaniphilus TaxID=1166482 RepID=UPI00140E29D3|nr:glycoside hydrolase family 32 protein [Pseudomaricurvus alcaniphilus]NHN39148.1 glycoside hydrolase family 32 protein [Pseudomaricurvus alcaniphilus]